MIFDLSDEKREELAELIVKNGSRESHGPLLECLAFIQSERFPKYLMLVWIGFFEHKWSEANDYVEKYLNTDWFPLWAGCYDLLKDRAHADLK